MIGKIQELSIVNFTSFGTYLDAGTGERQDNVLLPLKELPAGAKEGDLLEVFIYRDSQERLIATRRRPPVQAGELACLEITAKTKIGAFMDIGLERGLFLPFREQKYPVRVGKRYLIRAYLDKSGRLCASTDVAKYLAADSPYEKNDKVTGTVYGLNRVIGAFVAVENRYLGLIPESEYFRDLEEGDAVEARVIRVREDGKLDLSLRDLSHIQIDEDAEKILREIKRGGGFLGLNDKSDPEEIQKLLQMSKGAFKKAVGRLLKEKKAAQSERGLHDSDLTI